MQTHRFSIGRYSYNPCYGYNDGNCKGDVAVSEQLQQLQKTLWVDSYVWLSVHEALEMFTHSALAFQDICPSIASFKKTREIILVFSTTTRRDVKYCFFILSTFARDWSVSCGPNPQPMQINHCGSIAGGNNYSNPHPRRCWQHAIDDFENDGDNLRCWSFPGTISV